MPRPHIDSRHALYERHLLGHLERFFDGHTVEVAPVAHPIINRVSPDFAVATALPGPRTSCRFYMSVGAGLLRETDPLLEFAILSREPSARHRLLLAMVAYYHHTEGLGVDHTFPIGEPWLPGSTLTHLIVSRPYPFGPQFENVAGDVRARLLWLLPITEAERKLKVREGAEALEQRFDRVGLEYWNPFRECVATDSGSEVH
ncbi:MAG: suppressor of fused domain protein [Polyangiaceae bacterium]|nr:suppressor of fused domain protein [Polyangiaceae bacterium]